MLNKYSHKDDQICIVVNNELVCVDEHGQEEYEERKFEKKLDRAAKSYEKDIHHDVDHYVNNGFTCLSTD